MILETVNSIASSNASSKVNTLINAILNGTDANNDEKTPWIKGEGMM